jgi:hypothetical protein
MPTDLIHRIGIAAPAAGRSSAPLPFQRETIAVDYGERTR